MKRMLVLFLMLALLGLSAVCETELPDLTVYSDDEIIAIAECIMAEYVDRNIEKSAELPKGRYTGGEDIPCGKYIYTCMAEGSQWGSVTIREDGGSGKQSFFEVVSAPEGDALPETFYMTISEGAVLDSAVPFKLTISGTVLFK